MILLDTHVLIWLTADSSKMSRSVNATIRRARRDGGLAISAISLWELAWMATHGRLERIQSLEAYLEETCRPVTILPITPRIAALANQFPSTYPNDPCDRLIGATALSEGLVLITKNERIRACQELRSLW